jgi:UDPglucose--hexose-1-phosphate uridylyltransferase
VIAPGRAARPGAAASGPEPVCPFCEGNETLTPPELLAVGPPDRTPDTPGWRVRVVPNKFPALDRQEVVVHSPRHVGSLAELAPDELAATARCWQLRARDTPAGKAAYLHAFVNEGRPAGASIAHSHSQLAWLPEVPPEALPHAAGEPCPVCRLLEEERATGTRVLLERDGLLAVCPFASKGPYELLVAPVRCEPNGFDSPLLALALALAAELIGRLRAIEGDVPFNAWLRTAPLAGGACHWRLEVLPRLVPLAGLELGAGLFVNPLAPEEAAARLRATAY